MTLCHLCEGVRLNSPSDNVKYKSTTFDRREDGDQGSCRIKLHYRQVSTVGPLSETL